MSRSLLLFIFRQILPADYSTWISDNRISLDFNQILPISLNLNNAQNICRFMVSFGYCYHFMLAKSDPINR